MDYPNLSNYVRDLYQQPGVAETVNMDHIKRHYYGSQKRVNPTGIVPLGPPGAGRFRAPHDRGRFGGIDERDRFEPGMRSAESVTRALQTRWVADARSRRHSAPASRWLG